MAELTASIGARELDRWAIFYGEEPWGSTRDNLHAAMIASVIANVHRGRKQKAFSPSDFMIVGQATRTARAKAGSAALLKFLRATAKGRRKQAKTEKKRG